MKIGQRAKIKETGELGFVHQVDDTGKATHLKLVTTGKVVEVIDKTITILSLIKWIVEQIKLLLNK